MFVLVVEKKLSCVVSGDDIHGDIAHENKRKSNDKNNFLSYTSIEKYYFKIIQNQCGFFISVIYIFYETKQL